VIFVRRSSPSRSSFENIQICASSFSLVARICRVRWHVPVDAEGRCAHDDDGSWLASGDFDLFLNGRDIESGRTGHIERPLE